MTPYMACISRYIVIWRLSLRMPMGEHCLTNFRTQVLAVIVGECHKVFDWLVTDSMKIDCNGQNSVSKRLLVPTESRELALYKSSCMTLKKYNINN